MRLATEHTASAIAIRSGLGNWWCIFVLLGTLVETVSPAALAQPFAYVTNQSAGTVSVIDTATQTVTATIPVYEDPFFNPEPVAVAVTPDGAFVYVANEAESSVAVIDTATNQVHTRIFLDSRSDPSDIAITPDGSLAYATGLPISVIDVATNTVIDTIEADEGGLKGVAISPNGDFAYVTDCNGGTCVIDTETQEIVDVVNTSGGAVTITPDGSFGYTTTGDLGVSVFVIATNMLLTRVPIGSAPSDLDVTPDGALVYVVRTGSITAIDTATFAISDSFKLPDTRPPRGIAITPDGGSAYITFDSNNVAVFDLASNQAVATIPVGRGPRGLAIGPQSPATATVTPTPTPTPTQRLDGDCVGDCDGSGRITVSELVLGISIALELTARDSCEVLDINDDGRISIEELVAAVNAALRGCALAVSRGPVDVEFPTGGSKLYASAL